ncbi:MAG TPA: adenylate kinase [Synergistaceae bacterium]|nr:adenylate kinase [Synergistaceae bacterium]
MRLVFIGPPGAGKGTQAATVREKFAVAHISTGDILRSHVARGTPLGLQAKSYMDAGKLVPDGVMIDLIKNRLGDEDCRQGFILDGFPRTVAQAEALDQALGAQGQDIDKVILFQVTDEVVVERLCSRRVCKQCGAIYHVTFHPTKQEGICDACGGAVIQRDDDREEVIRHRLQVYHDQAMPLVAYYRAKGILAEVDGGVRDAVLRVLASQDLQGTRGSSERSQ